MIGSRLFIRAIIEDQPVSPNFADGLKVAEIIDAAIEADRQGCWVPVDYSQTV
jgi:predicted dehydrogenase